MQNQSLLSCLTLRCQIILSLVPVLLLVCILAFYSYSNFKVFSDDFETLSEVAEERVQFSDIDKQLTLLQRQVLVYSYLGYNGVLKKIEFIESELESAFESLAPIAEKDPEVYDRFSRMIENYEDYKEAFSEVVEKKTELKSIRKDTVLPIERESREILNQLIEKQQNTRNYELLYVLIRMGRNLLQVGVDIVAFETSPDAMRVKDITADFFALEEDAEFIENTLTNAEDLEAIRQFKGLLEQYRTNVFEIVTINRVYLHLVNVVLSGKAAEIDVLSKELGTLIADHTQALTSNTLTNLHKAQNTYIFLALIVILGGVISAVLIAMSISKPVNAMAETLSALAKGEAETPIPALHRKDEVGQMAKAANEFKNMAFDLEAKSQEIEEAKKFQDLIFESIPDLLFVKDEKFRIVETNPAFLSVYPNDTKETIIGKTTVEQFSEEDATEFLKFDRQALEEGLSETEETVTFPSGSTQTLLTKKIRFHNNKGDAFILGISRDITAIKKAEDELVMANNELEEFAYRTSHDLRSPLVSSIGILNLTKSAVQNDDKDKALESIEHIQSSLSKLETLITDILSLTEVKHAQELVSTFSYHDVFEEALDKLSHMEQFKRLDIQTDFTFGDALTTQESRFRLILENLISNAVKYQNPDEKKPYIKISTYEKDDMFVLEVEDNGLGIPDDQHEKLFTMFKRFHPKISYGSGLGLYMIKKSADIINAEIQFENPDKGTIFRLLIPLGTR